MSIVKISLILGAMLFSFSANASIINPSFEDGLTGWSATKVGTSWGYGSSSWPVPVTDGSQSVRMYSTTTCLNKGCGGSSFSSGDYIGLSQSLDFTNITEIQFDSTLLSSGQSSPTFQSFTRAAAYIGSTLVWSEVTLDEYLNIAINTTLFSGIQSLEFRIEATGDGVDSKSDQIYLDNIRTNEINAVPIPAAAFMFAPALLGFLGLRRRAKNTVA